MEKQFTLTTKIKANREKVWEALTNPDKIEQYMFGSRTDSNWHPGNDVNFYISKEGKNITVVKGKVIKADKPVYLEHTLFPAITEMKDIPENYLYIIYEIKKDKDGETLLTITQGDFSKVEQGKERYDETVKGWETVLPKLKEIAES